MNTVIRCVDPRPPFQSFQEALGENRMILSFAVKDRLIGISRTKDLPDSPILLRIRVQQVVQLFGPNEGLPGVAGIQDDQSLSTPAGETEIYEIGDGETGFASPALSLHWQKVALPAVGQTMAGKIENPLRRFVRPAEIGADRLLHGVEGRFGVKEELDGKAVVLLEEASHGLGIPWRVGEGAPGVGANADDHPPSLDDLRPARLGLPAREGVTAA